MIDNISTKWRRMAPTLKDLEITLQREADS